MIPNATAVQGYGMSLQQRRIWDIQKYAGIGALNNLIAINAQGAIDISRLGKAVSHVVGAHEIFRCNLRLSGLHRYPVQVISESSDIELTVVEYHGAGVKELLEREKQTRFDLELGPAIRISLIRITGDEYVFCLCAPALFADCQTLQTICSRIFAFYFDERTLPAEHDLQYIDYSEWQNGATQGKNSAGDQNDPVFASLRELQLPFESVAPAAGRFSYALIDAGEADHRMTDDDLTVTLLTLWHRLLSRYVTSDLVIGYGFDGRSDDHVRTVAGPFARYIPLQAGRPGKDEDFESLRNRIEEAIAGSQNYRETYSLRSVDQENNFIYFPFTFDFIPLPVLTSRNNISFSPCHIEPHHDLFKLRLLCIRHADSIKVSVEYDRYFFDDEVIRNLCVSYRSMLQAVSAKNNAMTGALNTCSKEELQLILDKYTNGRVTEPQHHTVTELFDKQVRQHPSRTAVRFSGRSWSYQDTDQQANQIADFLIKTYNVRSNDVIAVCVQRSDHLILVLLGILKAGATYLPIDTGVPEKRLGFMLDDSASKLLITDSAGYAESTHRQVLLLPELIRSSAGHSPADVPVSRTPDSIAYLIYTSGTTGSPKGVQIEDRSLINYVSWFIDANAINCEDQTLLLSSVAFDLCYTSLWTSLLSGACLHVVAHSDYFDPDKVIDVLCSAAVSYVKMTPSHFRLLLDNPGFSTAVEKLRLRLIVLGGENSNVNDIERFLKLNSSVVFMNHYGPTETTIGAIAEKITGDSFRTFKACPVIGAPVSNMNVYILGHNNEILPFGVSGEICISGIGVSKGYLNNPELTGKKYMENLWYPVAAWKLFKTGDIGSLLPNGKIRFEGRADKQVKINGHRIELQEIESRLCQHPAVTNAWVTLREFPPGDQKIVAYVESRKVSVNSLSDHLLAWLPQYMMPSHLLIKDQFPVTPNGKIDRAALLGSDLPSVSSAFAAPETEAQQRLASAWKAVLMKEKIGINDNFFALGGDSIKAIQVASLLFREGYKLDVRNIFQFPTIAMLCTHLESSEPVSDQSAVTGPAPLAPMQQVFLESRQQDLHHYNQALLLTFRNRVDAQTIGAIFSCVHAHHDILRTVFKKTEGHWMQEYKDLNYPVLVESVQVEESGFEERFKTVNEKLQSTIDIENGPLFRICLFETEICSRLLLVAHHLIIDSVSWRILIMDVELLLKAYAEGRKLELPGKSSSFRRWIEEVGRYASTIKPAEAAYWEATAKSEVQVIRKDFDEGVNYSKDCLITEFMLTEEQTKLLAGRSNNAFNTNVQDILLTALGVTIHASFDIVSVCIALEGHGRESLSQSVDVTRTMGWFSSVFPFILDVTPAETSMLLKRTKEDLRKIPGHGIAYLPLRLSRNDMATRCRPDLIFNYLGAFDHDISVLSFKVEEIDTQTVSPRFIRPYPLAVSGHIVDRTLRMTLTYNALQFKSSTMETFWGRYKDHLLEVITYCSKFERGERTGRDFTYKLSADSLEKIRKMF